MMIFLTLMYGEPSAQVYNPAMERCIRRMDEAIGMAVGPEGDDDLDDEDIEELLNDEV